MGGYGSGARPDPTRAKRLVEDCAIVIDVDDLLRAGVLKKPSTGTVNYGPHDIAFRTHERSIELAFTVVIEDEEASETRQVIELATSKPGLGGERLWFSCGCGRRCGKAVVRCG